MAQHIAWGSIELLHNVVRTLKFLNEREGTPIPVVRYRGKVKLHGTNCGVQITPDGLVAQSRTGLLTPTADLHGFAKWVEANRTYFQGLPQGITIFGEWCGPGVEKGMAISKVAGKVFAVFAVQSGLGAEAVVAYDPEVIQMMLGTTLADMHVLPWLPEADVTIDFRTPDQEVERLNRLVEAIEKEDPWVKATFGVSGMGEGIVFYPTKEHSQTSPEALARLMWKAKGEKHRTAGVKQAVQVAPEVVKSVGEFVTLMVTEARLQQGVSTACGGDRSMRYIGDFLRWVGEDTKKESVAELEAAGLTWDQVQKAVQDRARDWYKAQAA